MFDPVPEDTPTDAANLLRWGRIASVDTGAALCTVELAEGVESPPLPWFERAAGTTRSWSAPALGEQVLLLCPEGEIAAGAVLRGLSCDAHPALYESAKEVVRFSDGATVSYDPEARLLKLDLTGAMVELTAETVRIHADMDIEGNISLTGKMTASDDVIASSKSLKSHKHNGVTAGGGVSGLPQ